MCELKSAENVPVFARYGHTLTGVWVEIGIILELTNLRGHTLTGVWVEILQGFQMMSRTQGHTLTGVWVEIRRTADTDRRGNGHTLTGVWVEISYAPSSGCTLFVTPSRVCELKFSGFISLWSFCKSHPHGCVSWNDMPATSQLLYFRHTLTGVWVEIELMILDDIGAEVTPSRVCELKSDKNHRHIKYRLGSHPHGCVSWNEQCVKVGTVHGKSHPHGCVSWNYNKFGKLPKRKVTPSRVCELKYLSAV